VPSAQVALANGIELRVQNQVRSLDASAEPPPRERLLSSIQALRALAAWSVVFHHYCLIFKVSNPSWWRRAFVDHGAAGVDVFFVVSGLVMGLSASDPTITPRRFMAKRLARIVPAYWLYTLVVALLITRLPEVMVNQGYSPEFLAKSLMFLPAPNPSGAGLLPINTVGWSLNVEMVFYVIVAASLLAPLPQRWLWIAGGVVLFQKLLSPLGIVSPLYADPILYEFLMGIAAAHLWQAGALRGRGWLFSCLALLALVCLLRPPPPSGLVQGFDYGVPAFLLVCAFLGLERYFARATLLVHLGNHSYSVYLIHPTILYVGWYTHRSTRGHGVLIAWCCIVAIAVVGAVSYRFFEKPAGRVVTRWLMPRDR
jgi:exopolysaccharide production protein ExoZ